MLTPTWQVRALKTALPQIPLIAAGGVNQQTAAGFILAGAAAIGLGTELIPTGAIEMRESARIQELAHRFIGFVNVARQRIAPQRESAPIDKTDFLRLHKPSPSGKK